MSGTVRGVGDERARGLGGLVPRRAPVLWLVGLLLMISSAGLAQESDQEVPDTGDSATEAEVEAEGEAEAESVTTVTSEAPAPPPARSDVSAADVLTSEYALRLQELEDRVNDLKEEIFRSKSRLVLLRERVLHAAIGGSQAVITHVNDMSATFDLHQVIYSLDGNQIYSATDSDGSLADQDRFEIYNGAIVPGPHNIAVEMTFVGNGFGLFSYLDGYRFRLRSSYPFTAEEGNVTSLDVVAYEQGGVNQPIEERPDIRYELEYETNTPSVAEPEE